MTDRPVYNVRMRQRATVKNANVWRDSVSQSLFLLLHTQYLLFLHKKSAYF